MECSNVMSCANTEKEDNIHHTLTIIVKHDSLEIFRKCMRLISEATESRRLFCIFSAGRCVEQVVSVKTMGRVPQKITEYTKLPHLSYEIVLYGSLYEDICNSTCKFWGRYKRIERTYRMGILCSDRYLYRALSAK